MSTVLRASAICIYIFCKKWSIFWLLDASIGIKNYISIYKVISSVWSDDDDEGSEEYEEEEEEVVSVIESSIISTEAILEESDSEIISRVEVHTNTIIYHKHISTLIHIIESIFHQFILNFLYLNIW